MKHWTERKKIEYDIQHHKELSEFYELISKLCIVCIDRNIPLIIENPYSTQHYLQKYWCVKPKLIDLNRNMRGDYYKKPTQYWFINCEPKNNLIFEPYTRPNVKTISATNNKVQRSMISPVYANRFIRENILESEELDF